MANNLYTVASIGATFAQNKSMITLYNSTGSGKILKVWKIWGLNNQSVAVTGVLAELQIWKISSSGGGGALTPLKHNSSIPNLSSLILSSSGATDRLTSLFRRVIWSTDEPVATETNMDVYELRPSWNVFYDVPITNSIIEPIVLNQGEGITVYNVTNTSVGQADFFIEFSTN